jgi:uncharacterized protein YbaR (Trm112 family)
MLVVHDEFYHGMALITRVMVCPMVETKLYFQCRTHRRQLVLHGPAIVEHDDGGFHIIWDNFLCPKHPKLVSPSCKRKWRIMIVESGQVVIK